MRATLSIVGLALFILVTVGHFHAAAHWLVRLDLIVGLLSVWALFLPDRAPRLIAAAPLLCAALLIVGALVGLQRGAEPWLCWAGISFGLGELMIAVAMKPLRPGAAE